MLKTARMLALLAALSATLTLMGYGAHIYALTNVRPGFQGMSTLTAISLVLLAASVLATTAGLERWRQVTAWLAALSIAPVLLSYMVKGSDLVSAPIAVRVFGVPPEATGRTALATALSCALLTVALLMRRSRPRITDAAAGVVGAVAATALLGYAYGVRDLYAFWIFNTMALHTAASLLVLSVAVVFSAPGVGWSGIVSSPTAGGSATRRQLSVLLVPPVVGWLLLSAVKHNQLGFGAAMALMVVFTIWPLGVLIMRDGRTLVLLDNARRGRAELQGRHSAELQRQLAQQAAELEQASADRLSTEATLSNAQRMETLGQLTGGIAHDFNNLLMAISGNLQLIRRRLPKERPEHRYVENAIAATEKGAKVTGQLLAFSRSQRLSVGATDVQLAMSNACALIGNALGPGISLKLDGAPDLWARTDADQLELALLNLAVNARDAMPSGGTITLASHASTDREWVRIRVTDTGVGMPPEVLARAGEPFFTTKERGKGTGLGLAQVHGFALQCNGSLAMESVVGVGTTVQISLPRVSAPPTALPAAANETFNDSIVDSERHALVIDDDDAVRSVVVDALEDLGFKVQFAPSGVAGLAALKNYRPDVAVIDFLMPGMNGAEVAKAAQKLHAGLPIVFISGYSDTLALDGIADAVVLRKPFEIEDLARALQAVIDRNLAKGLKFGDSTMAPLG